MRGEGVAVYARSGGTPSAGLPLSRGHSDHPVQVAGTTLLADPDGALFWPEEKLLVVADLHLEKGSAFAKRGVLLPPYDTASTLARLARLVEHYAPRILIALGDSFHDDGGPLRMSDLDRIQLKGLQRGRDWVWIAGNHDPDLPPDIGGRFADTLSIGGLTFRHEPSARESSGAIDGEIAGHLHPVARVAPRGRAGSPRLFRPRGPPHGHAGIRRLCGRSQRMPSGNWWVVRRADVHGAHARCTTALRDIRRALLAGLTPRPRLSGRVGEIQSLLKATLAIQPVASAMQAVASP